MEMLIIFVTAFTMVVLTRMNRVSRQLGKGVDASSRTWQISSSLIKKMHWVMLSSGGLLLVSLIIGGWLDGQYPTLHFPALNTVFSYLIVFGGFVLSASAIVITANLVWRVILCWGARNLIHNIRQAILSRVNAQQSKHLLKFIGQLCFAICVATFQMIGLAFLLLIRGVFNSEPEDNERYKGIYYDDYNSDTGVFYSQSYDE